MSPKFSLFLPVFIFTDDVFIVFIWCCIEVEVGSLLHQLYKGVIFGPWYNWGYYNKFDNVIWLMAVSLESRIIDGGLEFNYSALESSHNFKFV